MSIVLPVTRTVLVASPRVVLARMTTMHLALGVLVVLVGGILLSITTTTDPLWWHLHFSRLGTFRDTSGSLFNGTLIVAGFLVAIFANHVRRDLSRLGRAAGRRGSGVAAQAFLTTIGVNLTLVGFVPLNLNRTIHDNVAGTMVLGFAALLVTSPVLLHRMPRRLLATTGVTFAFLFASAWLFVGGDINLALFEVLAFSAMFAWSGVFTHCIALRAKQPVSSPTPPAATAAATAVSYHSTLRTGSHLAPRRRVRSSRLAPAAAPVAAAPARPAARYRRPAVRVASPAGPRPGYTASAGRAVSGRSMTPDRRSPQLRAAAR